MGTYTTNYQLFMPTVGEQGWGDLVNGNFATIDTTMKGLNTRMGTAETNITSLTTRMGTAETTITSNKSRIGTLETEMDAVEGRITTLEAGEFENINAGTIIADTIKGNISACFNAVSLTSDEIGLVSFSSSKTLIDASSTVNGAWGYGTKTFTYRANPFINTVTFNASTSNGSIYVQVNGVTILSAAGSVTRTLFDGDIVVVNATKGSSSSSKNTVSISWNCYLVNT